MDDYYLKKSLVVYLPFHQNGKPAQIQSSTMGDDLTTSHMRRKLVGENFTSARRRGPISLSMLKVPFILETTTNVCPSSPRRMRPLV